MTSPTPSEILHNAVGREVRDAQLGIGSNLTLDLGDNHHLWIHQAAWRIEDSKQVFAGSEDDRAAITAAIAMLPGRVLSRAVARLPGLEASFDFEGLRLKAFPIGTQPSHEHWMLFFFGPHGERRVLVAGPGSAWSVETSQRQG